MKLLVSGAREGYPKWDLERVLARYLAADKSLVIIEGCAPGVDTQAFEWAQANNIPVLHYPAPWNHLGKPAGRWRNRAMLKILQPDEVVCFHKDIENSKGTRDMALIAQTAGIPTQVVGSTLR